MCHMSDPARKIKISDNKRISADTLNYIADNFFPRALKLQIGCATEPTLYRYLPHLVKTAKHKGVPYISITTNGQLLTEAVLRDMIAEGLDEVTLSVHGLNKDIYEELMRGASFERFIETIQILKQVKRDYPDFKIRINYVMNSDNVYSLSGLYDVFDGLSIDILQLRPIQKLGDTAYNNFSLDEIRNCYDDIILPIQKRCAEDGTVCLCPTKENLDKLEDSFDPMVDYLEELTYYYITENGCNKENFDWKKDTFNSYHSKKETAKGILKSIICWNRKAAKRHSSKKMNYSIK